MMELLWQLLNWLSPASRTDTTVVYAVAWLPIAMLASALISAFASRRGSSGGQGDNEQGIPPELLAQLQGMMDLQQQEYQRADPLRMAVLQLAYRMMPTFAREGAPGLNLNPLVPGAFSAGGRTRTGTGGVPPAGRRDWTGPGPSDDELSRLAAVRHPRPWEILPGRRPGRFPPRSRRQMP